MSTQPLLLARDICKKFPGVVALDHVSFELRPGEVHVLLGENGAGKSTLVKIFSGALHRDAGEIFLDGEPVALKSPAQAQQAGISAIYQEFNLVPYLSAMENIFLAHEPRKAPGIIDRKAMQQQAVKLLAELGAHFDPGQTVNRLSVAEQQMVEIAKALSLNARIFIM
ncbi:MAG: sugar ABC transporter ATP-binding protein, partial [Calditrichaeota bacterium]